MTDRERKTAGETREAPAGRTGSRPGRALRALLGLAALAGCLLLTALYVRSDETAAAPQAAGAALAERFAVSFHNAASRVLDGLTYIRKIYRIPQGAPAPAPNAACYGSSADPAAVQAVIDGAAELLDGETVTAWTKDTVLLPGTEVRWYADDSLLALAWKEEYDGAVCTFCEVKLADPSQLRRKLSGDAYGSGIQKTATELAREDNAVCAINGDFYAFRSCGIRVWQGTLYLAECEKVDTCFFTEAGDMLFVRRGELSGWADAERFVEDNRVSFSVAFGPVLVENGVNVTPDQYPLGEIGKPYSRSVIGQLGKTHYLLMTMNFEVGYTTMHYSRDAADLFIAHGCPTAYGLDGGQTGTVVFGGELVNLPDFGWERKVSDMICFASAVPEGGAS